MPSARRNILKQAPKSQCYGRLDSYISGIRGVNCRQTPQVTVLAVTKGGELLRQQTQLNLQSGPMHGLQILAINSRSYAAQVRSKHTAGLGMSETD